MTDDKYGVLYHPVRCPVCGSKRVLVNCKKGDTRYHVCAASWCMMAGERREECTLALREQRGCDPFTCGEGEGCGGDKRTRFKSIEAPCECCM